MTPLDNISAATVPTSGDHIETPQSQSKVQTNAMLERAYDNQIHRREPNGCTTTHQSGYNCVTTYRPNCMKPQNYDAVIPKPNFRSYRTEILSKFRALNGVSRHRDRVNDYENKVDLYWKQPSSLNTERFTRSRARTTRGDVLEDVSLYPHGLSFAEDYLNEWDQRPECPRPKWGHYPENTSWQPPRTSSVAGDYSGTELILASEEAAPNASRHGLINLQAELRPWRISLCDADARVITESAMEDDAKSDSSDSSYMESCSIVDLFSSYL